MVIDDIRSNTELFDVARLFYGDECPIVSLAHDGGDFFITVDGKAYRRSYRNSDYSVIPIEHYDARMSKIALYDALCEHTKRVMPWGALTGVRPTKLFYECLRGGKTPEQSEDIMRRVYRVSDKRAKILSDIIAAQNGKVAFPPELVNLYIHIPYCTTRCTYCSFVSSPIGKFRAQSVEYVELLCDEVRRSIEFLNDHGKRILSVYIGGGTPTALDAECLDKLLDAVGNVDCEYTCEAGRPDTITEQKVDILNAHKVTRVCVNPQTLNDKTLAAIGRNHTSADFYTAYEIVRSRGFDINCDLIAGLDGETPDDFIDSFEHIKALSPQNITVHSLSKKNGSVIRYDVGENSATRAMTDYSLDHLGDYRPYYLYRQKRQACNLENIGFSLPGKECINNITTMEETASVMACGAGAISKAVNGKNIVRFANMRDIPLYIERYKEKLIAKFECFESVF